MPEAGKHLNDIIFEREEYNINDIIFVKKRFCVAFADLI